MEDVRKILLNLKAEGKSIILASHNKEDIKVLCDEVYEMDHGKLTASESSIYSCDKYRETTGVSRRYRVQQMCGTLMALAGEGAYKQEEKSNICVIKRKSLYFGLFFCCFSSVLSCFWFISVI